MTMDRSLKVQRGMIRNDFSYSNDDRSVFEGPGLFAEIEKLLK